jgi:hypothetical protein
MGLALILGLESRVGFTHQLGEREDNNIRQKDAQKDAKAEFKKQEAKQ